MTQSKLLRKRTPSWATKLTLRYQQFAQSGAVYTTKPEAIAEAA